MDVSIYCHSVQIARHSITLIFLLFLFDSLSLKNFSLIVTSEIIGLILNESFMIIINVTIDALFPPVESIPRAAHVQNHRNLKVSFLA